MATTSKGRGEYAGSELSWVADEDDSAIADLHICLSCHRKNGKRCSPCGRFLKLEFKNVKANALVRELVLQKIELRIEINNNHEPIIHRLPIEVSAYIFELALPPNWNDIPMRRQHLTKANMSAPLFLAAVCTTWRRIAMSTPQLWATLPITIGTEYGVNIRRRDLCQEWIIRSKTYPLSIWLLRCSRMSSIRPFDGLSDIVQLINLYSSRWKYLDIHLPYHLIEKVHGDAGGAPILDRLRIQRTKIPRYEAIPRGTFSLQDGEPSPYFLSTSYRMDVKVNWSNLRIVKLRGHIKDCLAVVEQAVGLLQLSFAVTGTIEEQETDLTFRIHKPLVHQTLHFLRIENFEEEILADLLRFLVLPGLRNLELSPLFDEPIPFLSIQTFIDCSSCLLTMLSINFGIRDVNVDQLAQFLKHMVHLTDLRLTFEVWSRKDSFDFNKFCRYLHHGSTASGVAEPAASGCEGIFLPKLSSLSIHGVSQCVVPDWQCVADIFERSSSIDLPPGRPLGALSIYFLKDIKIWDVPSGQQRDVPYELSQIFIDIQDIARFIEIAESGVVLDFQLPDNGDYDIESCNDSDLIGLRERDTDLLKMSMKHFGIDVAK